MNNEELVFQLIAMLVFGVICAAIAAGRGRSAVAWFFIGGFFTCLGLIVLLVVPDLRKLEAERTRQLQENRRLREQIRKDRQVADARHQGLERRIGAHDQALGLDTAAATAQLGDADAAAASPPPSLTTEDVWHYARGTERKGPVSVATLVHLAEAGVVTHSTLVWRQGFGDWIELRDVPELKGRIDV